MSREIFRRLRQMLMERLDMSRELSDKEILEMIDDLILNHMKDTCCSLKEKVELRQELFYSVRKLDVLQELIEDETVFFLTILVTSENPNNYIIINV